jgi:hypothetical protein
MGADEDSRVYGLVAQVRAAPGTRPAGRGARRVPQPRRAPRTVLTDSRPPSRGAPAPQLDQLQKRQGELQQRLARSEAEKRALQRRLAAPAGEEGKALVKDLQAEVGGPPGCAPQAHACGAVCLTARRPCLARSPRPARSQRRSARSCRR